MHLGIFQGQSGMIDNNYASRSQVVRPELYHLDITVLQNNQIFNNY